MLIKLGCWFMLLFHHISLFIIIEFGSLLHQVWKTLSDPKSRQSVGNLHSCHPQLQ